MSREKEVKKLEEQFDKFTETVKDLSSQPLEHRETKTEMESKISNKEMAENDGIYLKPKYQVGGGEKFNEKFRKEYEFDKERVRFIVEHKEIIGETVEMWTKPYAGVPAEFWQIPSNKIVNAPRYVAEQIKKTKYRRLKMSDTTTGQDGMGSYYGNLVADTIVQRIDAYPVSNRKSIFMG